ncbi:MAG: 5-formyltetrahydrofolate cyclo-ligase [Kiloniellales bacterium]|nr:5-formyltetrahydrofolate cyclo-ligase [Kiloniellales bacterium]
MTTTLRDEKRRLRAAAKARRATAAASAVGAAEAVCRNLVATVPLPGEAVVSAYWPMGSELDPRPLMMALHRAGHKIALPVVIGADQPLVFRAWSPGDELEPAAFDTQVPGPDKPELTPAVVLVPLLAFDRRGYRLGYGGGFYDRTLGILRGRGEVLAVGLAYAAQEVPAVPHDGNDKRLDWIVTEAEAIRLE